jgi:hypothetical protein
MTEDIREKMIASFEKTFDLPALLATRGFVVPPGERDPLFVEMTNSATGQTLLLRKDLDAGGWSFHNPANPTDRGRAAEYFINHEKTSREQSLDRLIGYATERNSSPDATAYRRACRAKSPELRAAEDGHKIALLQEKATQRLLRDYGVQPSQIEGGRFGQFRKPSDLDRLVADPKGLNASAFRPTDQKIVFTERPLDGIAYDRAVGNGHACYMYTGANPSPESLHKIAHVLAAVRPPMSVVLAYGQDDRGRELAARLRALAPTVQMQHEAPKFGVRWGDQLQLQQRHERSMQRVHGRDLSR